MDRHPPAQARQRPAQGRPAPVSPSIRAKSLLKRLLHRVALVVAGGVVLLVALWLNVDAGGDIIAGLFSPETPTAIVVSVARLLPPVIGLWLVYAGLR